MTSAEFSPQYLLSMARDFHRPWIEAAQHLRREFAQNPPNATARFVDFSISREGLAITRS